MQIHALTTGTVQIKTRMERGQAPLRLARALLDRRFTHDLPIHAWLIEHPDGPILVDTGELASTPDPPIARFHVQREDEIDRQLEQLGLAVSDLSQVVLTHLHGDHMNGVIRLGGVRVLASAEALARGGARRLRRRGVDAQELRLEPRPFGAFARSAPITGDGAVLAVPVPGHARGQIAVVVVEDGRHVMIAGDSAYSEAQLLDQQVDGVSTSARQAAHSMRTILEHARSVPVVYLPSHDPQSAARLQARTPVPAQVRPSRPAPAPASVGP